MLSDRQIQSELKKCQAETVLNDGAGGKGNGSLVLVIRRRASGCTANWYGQWWQDGARKRLPLGAYPAVPLGAARELYAQQVRDVLAAGKNPRAMVILAPADRPTVQQLFQEYCDQMDADGKTSAKEVRRCLDIAALKLGASKMAGDIEPVDVSAYLATIYNRGSKVAADRERSYLSAAFNFGIHGTHDYRQERRRDWGIKANPVTAVKKDSGVSVPRERALTAKELARVWHAAGGPGFSLETQAAVRLLIATGQRVQEVLRIEAHEIDLDGMVWNMPAPKTKGKKNPHTVPLPEVARPVLQELLKVHRRGWLMPGRTGDIMEHQVVNKALARWQNTLEGDGALEPFQSRDLRRTWKSRAADAGVDRFTRDLIQQHAMGDTGSRHYDRADYLPAMRAAMDKWNDWLASAIAKHSAGPLAPLGAVQAQLQA